MNSYKDWLAEHQYLRMHTILDNWRLWLHYSQNHETMLIYSLRSEPVLFGVINKIQIYRDNLR
jgi:hypothetical protein